MRLVNTSGSEPTVTIGVVFQDNPDEIRRLVESLKKIDLSYCSNIVAVDNLSTDHNVLIEFESLHINKKLIRNDRRESLPYNRNQCIKNATGSIVLFIDSDTEFNQVDFLNVLSKNFWDTKCDIGAPIVLSPDGTIQSVGFVKNHYSPYFIHPIKQIPKEPQSIDMIHGACFAVRRTLFEEIGMLDEFMEPYNFDEMDFVIRALLHRKVLKNFGNLRIIHHSGGTTSKFAAEVRALLYVRHAIRSIKRNYCGVKRFLFVTEFIIAAQFGTFIRFRSLSSLKIVPKAIIWNIVISNVEYLYKGIRKQID